MSKTFVVTGGNSGLGEATVRAFFAEGYNVAIFDRDDASNLVSELNVYPRLLATAQKALKWT